MRTCPLHRSLSLSIDPSDAPLVDYLARDLVNPGQVCFGLGTWGMTHVVAQPIVSGRRRTTPRTKSNWTQFGGYATPFATQV